MEETTEMKKTKYSVDREERTKSKKVKYGEVLLDENREQVLGITP